MFIISAAWINDGDKALGYQFIEGPCSTLLGYAARLKLFVGHCEAIAVRALPFFLPLAILPGSVLSLAEKKQQDLSAAIAYGGGGPRLPQR